MYDNYQALQTVVEARQQAALKAARENHDFRVATGKPRRPGIVTVIATLLLKVIGFGA